MKTIIIIIQGGVVQEVWSDVHPNPQVLLYDFDNEDDPVNEVELTKKIERMKQIL